MPPFLPHGTRPEGEVEHDLTSIFDEIHETTSELDLDLAMRIICQRHVSDAPAPGLLIEREPNESVCLHPTSDGRLACPRRSAHKNDPNHGYQSTDIPLADLFDRTDGVSTGSGSRPKTNPRQYEPARTRPGASGMLNSDAWRQ